MYYWFDGDYNLVPNGRGTERYRTWGGYRTLQRQNNNYDYIDIPSSDVSKQRADELISQGGKYKLRNYEEIHAHYKVNGVVKAMGESAQNLNFYDTQYDGNDAPQRRVPSPFSTDGGAAFFLPEWIERSRNGTLKAPTDPLNYSPKAVIQQQYGPPDPDVSAGSSSQYR